MDYSQELVGVQLQSGAVTEDELAASSLLQQCSPPVAHFGNPIAEYEAATTDCVLFDLSDRIQIELAGKDAASFLHKFCTNDIQRLSPGQGCEAFVTSIKGRILGHILAFVTESGICIDSCRGDERQLQDHFDRYIFSEDIEIHGRTQTYGDLYVSGPHVEGKLESLGIVAQDFAPYQHALKKVNAIQIALRRVDLWEQPGFFISGARAQLVDLWQALASSGMQPAGACAFHALRIQANYPLYGIDIGEDNLAQEANRSMEAISFTKGCYLGQEPIARIDAIGHINRKLMALRAETIRPLPNSADVRSADGAVVGQLTSAVPVPGTAHTVALAIVRTSHAAAGTQLTIANDGNEVIAATPI